MDVVTLPDLAALLINMLEVFSPYLQFIFSMMVGFYIAFNVKKLVLGG